MKFKAMDNQAMKQPLNENGFTMIEVLVALAIFAIGMLGISAMQIQSTSANTTARISTEQTAFAADLMEKLTRVSPDESEDGFPKYEDFEDGELSHEDINDITGLELDSSNTTADGIFIVNCTVDENKVFENTKKITLTITDTRRGGDRRLTFSHIIPRR